MSLIVSGTPSATPEAVPKLVVMSLRTTPVSVSTWGRWSRRPGRGRRSPRGSRRRRPSTEDAAPPAGGAPPGPPPAGGVARLADVDGARRRSAAQATSPAAPRPPKRASTPRRATCRARRAWAGRGRARGRGRAARRRRGGGHRGSSWSGNRTGVGGSPRRHPFEPGILCAPCAAGVTGRRTPPRVRRRARR